MADREPPIDRKDPDADAVVRGYEARDFNIRAAMILLGGLTVLLIALCVGLWQFQRHLLRRPIEASQPLSAVAATRPTSDAPPLQPQRDHASLDAWDLKKMRDAEDATFAAIGWQRDGGKIVVPAAIVNTLRQRQSTSRPAEGGR